jgi:hypothetical protein
LSSVNQGNEIQTHNCTLFDSFAGAGFAISAFLVIEIIFAFGILIRAGACTKLTIDLNYTATLATGPSVSLPITD